MTIESASIDEIAEYLKNSEARSEALFDNELSFVTEWIN